MKITSLTFLWITRIRMLGGVKHMTSQDIAQQKMVIKETNEELAKKKAINKTRRYTNCTSTAAYTIDLLHEEGMDIDTLISKLHNSVSRVNGGDIQEIEAMLMTQAHTMNVLFHRSLSQVANAKFVEHIQTFSDIALRAQNQCTKALSTLVAMKHPRNTTFIEQQNNAVNQQVNNMARKEKQKNITNELLEVNDEQRLDGSKAFTSIPANQKMEAMEIGRSKNRGRKEN